MVLEKILRTAGNIVYFCDPEQVRERGITQSLWLRHSEEEIPDLEKHRTRYGIYDYQCIGSYNPKESGFFESSWREWLYERLHGNQRNHKIKLAVSDGLHTGDLRGFHANFQEEMLLVRIRAKESSHLLNIDPGRILLKEDVSQWAAYGDEIREYPERPQETTWIVPIGDVHFKVGPIIDKVYIGISTRYRSQ